MGHEGPPSIFMGTWSSEDQDSLQQLERKEGNHSEDIGSRTYGRERVSTKDGGVVGKV